MLQEAVRFLSGELERTELWPQLDVREEEGCLQGVLVQLPGGCPQPTSWSRDFRLFLVFLFFFFAINNTIMNILKHQSECLSVYALRIKELRSHMGWQFLRILMIAFQRGLSTHNGDRAHSVAPSTVVAAKVTTTTEERASVCLMREAAFPARHGLLLIQFSRPPL